MNDIPPKPRDIDELSAIIRSASDSGIRLETVDLSNLAALLEHAPEDMTATVLAGMPLKDFQERIGRAGQWLPIDPPACLDLTIGDVLAHDRSGPRRFGQGTIRDYLIGIKVALADGTVIKAGGKVVKNVAGYDLCKLFIGARHSLGIIVEATFKLRPLPERETILAARFQSLDDLGAAARRMLDAPLEPVILDVHNLDGGYSLVAGFAGCREDVDSQVASARALADFAEGGTGYDSMFWNQPAEKISVLPSETAAVLARMRAKEFVARFGNGVIYFRQAAEAPAPMPPDSILMERVKKIFDPKGVFPEWRQ